MGKKKRGSKPKVDGDDSEENIFQALEEKMSDVVDTPEAFLTPSTELEEKLLGVTKHLFDFAKQQEPVELGPLPELLVEGFDTDQIWEEVQLQNQPLWTYLNKRITKLQDKKIAFFSDKKKKAKKRAQQKEDGMLEEDEEDKEDEEEAGDEDEEKEKNEDAKGDRFFDLDEMEDFIEEAEKEAEDEYDKKDKDKEDEEEDDDEEQQEQKRKDQIWEDPEDEERLLFPDVENQHLDENLSKMQIEARRKSLIEKMRAMSGGDLDRADGGVSYSEFFDPPKKKKKKVKWADEEDDEMPRFEEQTEEKEGKKSKKRKANKEENDASTTTESKGKKRKTSDDEESEGESEEDDDKPKESPFEIRSRRLAEKIKKLEDTNVSAKPWVLQGEATAYNRPINSLLETFVDFESSYKPKPVITAEVTQTLEQIIKQRIKEESWDDVIRKDEPITKEKKELPELNFEKNKEGLAAEYEKMYLEKTAPKTDAELSADQKEIRNMFKALCYKLDSLSNFHFTPKPPREEAPDRPNVPALKMEEIIPIGISDASLLAPEEIYEPKKEQEMKGSGELSREEKKTIRRTKKRKRNKQRKQKDAEFKQRVKLNPALSDPKNKSIKGAMESIKHNKNVIVAGNQGKATTSTQLFQQLTNEGKQPPKARGDKKPKAPQDATKFKL